MFLRELSHRTSDTRHAAKVGWAVAGVAHRYLYGLKEELLQCCQWAGSVQRQRPVCKPLHEGLTSSRFNDYSGVAWS